MPPTKTQPAFVRTGVAGLDELASDNSKFLKLKPGKGIELVPLTGVEGIVSFNQHAIWLDEGNSPIFPCFGEKWCPGEIIGDKPKFRSLLLVVTKEDPDTEMILPMGMSMFKQFIQIEEAIGGSMKGHVIRVTRTGEGLNTKYTVIPTGRRVKTIGEPETDLMEHLGPTTPEEVIEMLKQAGKWTDDHQETFDELYAESKKKKKKPAPKDEDEDEEDVDDTDVEDEDEDDAPPPKSKKASTSKGKSATSTKSSSASDDEDDDDFEDIDE